MMWWVDLFLAMFAGLIEAAPKAIVTGYVVYLIAKEMGL